MALPKKPEGLKFNQLGVEPVTVCWLVENGWDPGIHWPNRLIASGQLIEWRGAGLWIGNTPIAMAETTDKLRAAMAVLL